MIKNILVVCEGKKTEPKFINNLIREYLPSDNIEVYSFCTTIYQKRSAAKTPSFRAEIIARRSAVFNQVFSAGQYIVG